MSNSDIGSILMILLASVIFALLGIWKDETFFYSSFFCLGAGTFGALHYIGELIQ